MVDGSAVSSTVPFWVLCSAFTLFLRLLFRFLQSRQVQFSTRIKSVHVIYIQLLLLCLGLFRRVCLLRFAGIYWSFFTHDVCGSHYLQLSVIILIMKTRRLRANAADRWDKPVRNGRAAKKWDSVRRIRHGQTTRESVGDES